MNEVLKNAVVESLRYALLGAFSLLVTLFTNNLLGSLASMPQSTTIVALTMLLRFIDDRLVKTGIMEHGLTRF